jgi:phosphoribosylformylglycinamidine cyclo-ligase
MKSNKAYARAGVDVELGNAVKRGIHALVRSTHGPEVLSGIGGFGGLFRADFRGMKEPVLVASTDGVGTKLKLAFVTGRHDTIGQDLVNHCINDIAVTGAKPLFFLDYMAGAELDPGVFRQVLRGFAKACKAGGCALIGGETAQMPGMYLPGEYDLAGTIVGVVDRHRMLGPDAVQAGDVLVGLPSNGLHTNGYSLARRVLFETMGLRPDSRLPGIPRTISDELLRIHKNYQPALASLPHGAIKAAAHITGGGLIDNLPRVLPEGCQAMVRLSTWKEPAIFRYIREGGSIDPVEMYQVFNMGIGMVLVVPRRRAQSIARALRGRLIGEVVRGKTRTVLV